MAAEVVRLIGSPMLKILYDVYHMQINEGNLCWNIRQFADTLSHIHIADVPGRHEPGTGEINCAKVLKCMDETGYNGIVGYDLFPETDTAAAVKTIMKLKKEIEAK